MAPKTPGLSILIPVYNEQATLDPLIERLGRALDLVAEPAEILFVNDGSTDETAERLRQARQHDARIRIIHFSRNFGHQRAITAGIDLAAGAACIIMDGDLQDPPEVIPELVARWKAGYDVVHAVREERQGETWTKKFTAHLFYRLIRSMAEVPISMDAGDFRLIDRKVVLALRGLQERGRFVRGLVNWVGFRQTTVVYVRQARFAGQTKFSLVRMMSFAIDAITSFSIIPLRIATTAGLILSSVGFLYALVVLYEKLLTTRTVAGWSSLMVGVLLFGGVQLICLGVLGEYVGRIYNEVKGRPLYLVQALEGFDEESAFSPKPENVRAN